MKEKGRTILIKGLPEMDKFAAAIVAKLPKALDDKAQVIALKGDLGAGKTTFAQAFARALQIKDNITSPTFVLEKIYLIPFTAKVPFTHLIHIDCYRFSAPNEVLQIGWGSLISNPHNLILIEWPELIGEQLPSWAQMIKFEFVDENTRRVIL
jgi:tRNA threonylcarbamoyladenosine biosynthesis protein TsaE